jgi:hypothetical protein
MSEETPDPIEAPQGAEAEPTDESDWKNQARRWERQFKELNQKYKEAEPIVSQWRQLEEASKTELQRAQEELTRWQSEANTWRTQAVSSRVETLASADFADPSDALAAVSDPAKYLGVDGVIDEAAIKADLAALLERKPHWRRAEQSAPAAPRVPAPNPAQGSGVNGRPAQNPAAEFQAFLQRQIAGG